MAFHEVQFPTFISQNSNAGPSRRTEIVELASGHEERNALWANSRHRYDAGYGVRNIDDMHAIIAFFEARNARLHGFRFKDWSDFKSCPPDDTVAVTDQIIGTGNGVEDEFQIIKTYTSGGVSYVRTITKIVAATVLVSVNGVPKVETTDYTVNYNTGIITFGVGDIPANGHIVRAGYEFDVPCRFDTDHLLIALSKFRQGQAPNIPIIEIRDIV